MSWRGGFVILKLILIQDSFEANSLLYPLSQINRGDKFQLGVCPMDVESVIRIYGGLLNQDKRHGPYECVLNTVEACAIDAWPNLNQHFPFISCIESFVLAHEATGWKTCFEKTSLDSTVIKDCIESGYGKKLELKYAEETNSLEPPHQYVPWVVLNGQPLYEDYENVEEYICKAYEGTLPQACGSLLESQFSANAEGKGEGNRVCLKDTLVSSI